MLVVAPEPPQPDVASGERRFNEILQICAGVYRIDFIALCPARADADRYRHQLIEMGVAFLGYGRRRAQMALLSTSYDVVVFEFYHVAQSLQHFARWTQPHSLLVIDSVDVHFSRELAAACIGQLDPVIAEKTRSVELSAYRHADLVLVCSEPDRQLLDEAEGVRTALVPNIVRVARRAECEREARLLFVGCFDHQPNAHGIRWFVEHCWSAIRIEVPEVRLTIVGKHAPPAVTILSKMEGITVAGFVSDLNPLLDSAQVSIAPLLYGGGMKGKVSEALAHGIPLVTTSTGAQGFGEECAGVFAVADSPEEFAAQVIDLLRTPERREQFSTRGQHLAAQRCSVHAAIAGLQPILDYSGGRTRTWRGRGLRWMRAIRWALRRVIARLQRVQSTS